MFLLTKAFKTGHKLYVFLSGSISCYQVHATFASFTCTIPVSVGLARYSESSQQLFHAALSLWNSSEPMHHLCASDGTKLQVWLFHEFHVLDLPQFLWKAPASPQITHHSWVYFSSADLCCLPLSGQSNQTLMKYILLLQTEICRESVELVTVTT